MHHAIIAAVIYTAFVLQIVCGPAWSTAGVSVDLLVLAMAVPLAVSCGTMSVVWVAALGLLGDVLHQGPLGVGLAVGVVGAMAVAPILARCRTTIERLLWTALFLAGTTIITTLARGLVATPAAVDPTFALTATLHTLAAALVVAVVGAGTTYIVRRKLVRRF